MKVLYVGTRVRICKLGKELWHTPNGTEAIVGGNYPIRCGGHSFGNRELHQYSLYTMHEGKVVNSVSWFDREDMEIVSEDLAAGQDLIQAYHQHKADRRDDHLPDNEEDDDE